MPVQALRPRADCVRTRFASGFQETPDATDPHDTSTWSWAPVDEEVAVEVEEEAGAGAEQEVSMPQHSGGVESWIDSI